MFSTGDVGGAELHVCAPSLIEALQCEAANRIIETRVRYTQKDDVMKMIAITSCILIAGCAGNELAISPQQDMSPAPRWTVATKVNQTLNGVWAAAADDAWAVGTSGTILHWDGSTWTAAPRLTENDLNSVWGFSANDVWVAGDAGTMLHWSGSSWSVVPTPANAQTGILWHLWGANPNDVWALNSPIGKTEMFLHWDGTSWSAIPSGTSYNVDSIWGSSATDVWAGGGLHFMFHWDGSGWQTIDIALHDARLGMWGSAADDIWVVGPQFEHWDGKQWTTAFQPDANLLVASVWGSGRDDVWATTSQNDGYGAGGFLHWDGRAWSSVTVPMPVGALWGVFGTSAQDIWAVSSDGTILHYGR